MNLEDILKGKNVLITGGTGSIGSEIAREVLKYDIRQLRIYSRDETKQFELMHELGYNNNKIRYLIGDIRDKERMDIAFNGVQIVFHVAALKHVSSCEYNPFEVVKTNIIGSQNVIDLALKNHVEKVIAISTDKATDPTSVMGVSKLMMEKLIIATRYYKAVDTQFSAVRFGNVLMSRGSVIPLWIQQINKNNTITVTHKDMTRFFMEIPQAVKLVFNTLSLMQGEEVFILKMPKVKIIDLANKVVKQYGNNKTKIIFTEPRQGEKLYEKLLTEEESDRALETKDFFILLPQTDVCYANIKEKKYPFAKPLLNKKEYRSDK